MPENVLGEIEHMEKHGRQGLGVSHEFGAGLFVVGQVFDLAGAGLGLAANFLPF